MPDLRIPFFAIVAVIPSLAQAQTSASADRPHSETRLAPFPPEVRDSALISPDGRRIAYVKKAGGRELLVVDGEEQPAFDRVASPAFSPDSKWFAYAAAVGDTWRITVNARQRSPYPRVGPPVFSPNSRRLAYVVQLPDGHRSVMVNSKPGKPYDQILEGGILSARTANGLPTVPGSARPGMLSSKTRRAGPTSFSASRAASI